MEEKEGWFNIENLSAIIGPDGIQTSNEIALTRQTWVLFFLLFFVAFLLFVAIPRLWK